MDIAFLTRLLNGLLMVAIPIGLGFYLSRRFQLGWRLWWIGAATFVLSQVGHIPFNALVAALSRSHLLPALPAAWQNTVNFIALGLSAGLWEELSRAAVYRWWAKDARSWRKGVQMGAGHGGMEAIILGALVLYTFIQMAAYRNADLSRIFPAGQLALAQQQVAAYWSTDWPLSLLGAVERIFTLPCQIAMSVLVLQAFTRRQPAWVGLAILWHAFVDASALFVMNALGSAPWKLYAVEGWIGICALISIGIILLLRRPEPAEPGAEPQTPAAPIDVSAIQVPDTPESLDDSRYI